MGSGYSQEEIQPTPAQARQNPPAQIPQPPPVNQNQSPDQNQSPAKRKIPRVYYKPACQLSDIQIHAISTYPHEKYEEISYNIFGMLEQESNSISPTDLFYITTIFPEYCKSVNDMIRQSIRAESVKEEKEKDDYLSNYMISENLNYGFIKVIERYEIWKKNLHFFNEIYPSVSYFDSYIHWSADKEYNFNDILQSFRYT